ncbi:HAD-IIIA family hydrolase [Candidatus Actinomarina]|nr:HAD-IIIA family hydrolase [Candidatus Actinomarina sp.]|tara:strand:- start:4653 stop:5927 length:1275 start_codon:yes stop_codon:yes gene_type:complete
MAEQIIIIAGGKATRLKNELGTLPKCLVKIGNKTILDYQIENILRFSAKSIHFCLGFQHEKILDFLNNNYKNLNYTFSIEPKPLGTYGALVNSLDYLDENIFILFADILTNFNVDAGFDKFKKSNSDIMLITRFTDHPEDSDLIMSDTNKRVLSIEKQEKKLIKAPIGNSGLIFMKKNKIDKSLQSDFELDIMNDFVKSNLDSLNVISSLSIDYIKDIGTLERLEEQRKKIKSFSFEDKKVCFIDRDETIINDQGNHNVINEIKFKPFSLDLIKFLQKKSYKIILITNQPGVAKGFFSIEELEMFHNSLQLRLIEEGAKPLSAIYYCPHHPDKGFPDENRKYKINCNCRKPKQGLVKSAIKEFQLENSQYIFIGDTKADYEVSSGLSDRVFIVSSKHTEHDYFKSNNIEVYSNLMEVKKQLLGQ